MEMTCENVSNAPVVAPHVHRSEIEELTRVIVEGLPSFRRIALHQLGNMADAEDAVQDAFLSAYMHVGQFKGQAKMSTWVTRIVINSARMKLRRRRLWQSQIPLDVNDHEQESHPLSDRLSDRSPSPEEICGNREGAELLTRCLAKLSPRLRRTVQLRELDELSIRETAQVMGVPEGTVKARLARARVILKRMAEKRLNGNCASGIPNLDESLTGPKELIAGRIIAENGAAQGWVRRAGDDVLT
jgi:RNA polymerase sigma-70 factor (ECF subfamily)